MLDDIGGLTPVTTLTSNLKKIVVCFSFVVYIRQRFCQNLRKQESSLHSKTNFFKENLQKLPALTVFFAFKWFFTFNFRFWQQSCKLCFEVNVRGSSSCKKWNHVGHARWPGKHEGWDIFFGESPGVAREMVNQKIEWRMSVIKIS